MTEPFHDAVIRKQHEVTTLSAPWLHCHPEHTEKVTVSWKCASLAWEFRPFATYFLFSQKEMMSWKAFISKSSEQSNEKSSTERLQKEHVQSLNIHGKANPIEIQLCKPGPASAPSVTQPGCRGAQNAKSCSHQPQRTQKPSGKWNWGCPQHVVALALA